MSKRILQCPWKFFDENRYGWCPRIRNLHLLRWMCIIPGPSFIFAKQGRGNLNIFVLLLYIYIITRHFYHLSSYTTPRIIPRKKGTVTWPLSEINFQFFCYQNWFKGNFTEWNLKIAAPEVISSKLPKWGFSRQFKSKPRKNSTVNTKVE